ncbi:PAS domain S-box protein [Sphingomonas sp.]|uniref:PAS domain S-box protein n=1 Tax=Sphingomonas sp. TaxID=28214 RepID=UPI00307EA28A
MVEEPARDVLIVEDDPDTAELERRVLHRAGINAQLAGTVSEAKVLLVERSFQAVLLDYQLPDGDAWDVVELARSLTPPVPVVLVTAMGSERVVAEAIQHGVVEYVRKSERFLDKLADTVHRVARVAQFEANLRRSDALLQLIADHATDVILTLDDDGRLRYVSPASKRLLGWDTTDVVGHRFNEFVHADDQASLAAQLRSKEASNQAVFRCRRDDGVLIWVEANFQRIRDPESGAVTEILGILRNITERRAADERLRESEQRFRGAFETAAHGMALVSPEGRWLRVNRAICEMIGYSDTELLTIDFQTVTHPDDLDTDLAFVQAMLAGEIPTYQMEKRYFHKNGGLVWVLLSVSLVRSACGEPLYFVSQIQNITDQKLAEDALRRSEAEYRLLADHSNDMIVRIGLDGIRRYVSPACRVLLGFEPEEMVGETPLSVIHPEDRDRVVTTCESMLTGTPDPICAYRQLHRDGHYVWLEASLRLVRDDKSGEPLELIASVRDVSRRTEAELREAEAVAHDRESHRLLVMAETIAHVGHWRIDARTHAVFWSDEVFRIHGLELGTPPALEEAIEFYHPDDRQAVHDAIEKVMVHGNVHEFSARIIRPDGEVRNIFSRAQVERAIDGQIIGFIGAFLDVTEQARAEAAQRDEEARYRLLAENATDIIFRLDRENRFLYVSPAVRELTGFDPVTLIGRDPVAAMHPEDQPRAHEALAMLWSGTEKRAVLPYRTRCADGSWRWLEVTARSVCAASGGDPVEIIGASRDIAERKRFETELITTRDAAEAATHAKSDFLATMSHEVRTPMAGVLGMIELLRNARPEEATHLLDGLEQSAQMLTTVLDDILDFSKIEGERLILEDVNFDLRALSEQTFRTFEMSSANEKLSFRYDFAEDIAPDVRGDPTRLRQVIANLMSNAVKFTPEGWIELRVSFNGTGDQQGRWRIAVRDTGIGIDNEIIGALFSPFVQADASTTRKFGGTGLGLAICRRLIEAMGGEIGVESEPHKGSLFWFEVPLAASSADELIEPGPGNGAAPHQPLKVLLAEDNPINQTLVEGLLQRMGHAVSCVGHGRAAVEAVQSDHFDLVLMDMQMPEMDGPDAAATIRSLDIPAARVPIIALTADASAQRRRLYEQAGIDGFLSKPIDSAKLAAVLDQVGARRGNKEVVVDLPCETAPTSDLLDLGRLDLIARTLGRDQLDRLLVMLRDDIDARPASIRTLVLSDDIAAAKRSAHSLSGAALHLGAARLAEAAQHLESDETCASALIDEFERSAEETVAAIERYRHTVETGVAPQPSPVS